MPEPFCYLFVALPCEAKPLIEHFKLKKELSINAFSIYRNGHISLTVTGIGKSAMAAGVAYSLALFPSPTLPVLLNIGIAGHSTYSIGSVFTADKIIDQGTGRKFYPQLVSTPPCSTSAITTVSKPLPDYPSDSLFEMEASSFYETAIRFSSSELIQCIKVISDNKHNSTEQIKPAQVSLWLKGALPIIAAYMQQLSLLASLDKPVAAEGFAEIIEQWRFSSNEKLQLKSLLRKRAILIPHKALDLTEISPGPGKIVLNYLRKEMDKQKFGGF
ncbi:hypothetical protein [Methyloprofundus sp.]|uniref:5'-methylthioadenosine/S-adenosylhomocysteine nucleosidase family protein n=1 Tax=Methyloprofundus sp. TaxID=2020875 RepID=UPI003D0FA8C4